MKKIVVLLSIALFAGVSLQAQKQDITLEAIWNGTFRTEGLQALRSMNDGKHYTVLTRNGSEGTVSVDKFDYETGTLVASLVTGSRDGEIPVFSGYSFSDDESKLLLATENEKIFRRSKKAVYYVYDLQTKGLVKVADYKIQEPAISPDGTKVAYGYENNLYLHDLVNKFTVQLTDDGEKNAIINGITDWVYEEEFAFVRAFEWNSDGTKIAYLKFDESEVPQFSMDVYGSGLYQYPYTFKYPKAGEANATVQLYLFDIAKASTTEIDLQNPYYIPRIKWTMNPNILSVQTMNRHQDRLRLIAVNAKKGTTQILLEETDDAYVDITDNLTFLKDDGFIWTSERDGYNHIYEYGKDGKLKGQITKGPWEVTAYYGYDHEEDRIYYQSTENGSINRGVYSISSKGDLKLPLAATPGTNSGAFSADYTYFINTYSSTSMPPVYTLHLALSGKQVRTIKNNDGLLKILNGYAMGAKEFGTIEINGHDLNMYMIKPVDFNPEKSYPLFLYQYSGPGSQQVSNRWISSNDYWHQLLANKGIVIACVDGRGTGMKGRDFKKVTQKELGKYEVEDQIAVAEQLSDLEYIDEARTGIWGWSYGGFMSSNCLLKGNDVFEMAIAVAPVTNWRFYDTIYTERYMQTPQENPGGYDENSPINFADRLKGDYLLVHGSGDDNVHVQNTMRMIAALVDANKQFDWAIYPDKNHGISGGNTRLHLYTLMTDFVEEHLLHPDENREIKAADSDSKE